MLESSSIQELHGDKGQSILVTNVVNGADVGVVQGRSRLGLTLKAGQSLRVSGYFIGQELQRYETMQPSVLGFINDTHPAATKPFRNAVVRDGLADHQGQILRGVKPASQC